MNLGAENRPPRGALAVIAVGLLATVVAALLSTTKPIGAVALEWESRAPMPDSQRVEIPGGGSMQIVEAGLRGSEANASGYQLFRVVGVLQIDAASAVGQARVKCRTDVPRRTIPAKTPGSRASYPRSSSGEDLRKQEVPERVLVEFNSHGTDVASLELGDAFTEFVTMPGVLVSWPPYRQALQEWQWGLPDGRPEVPLALGFASMWRTTTAPSSRITCVVATAAGEARAETSGRLRSA
jgi:hypothetical protein